MKIDPDALIDVIVSYEVDRMDLEELANWAAELLKIGVETESIVLIAGLTKAESQEARTLLRTAVSELGFRYPSEDFIHMAHARSIARGILNGSIQPNEGCASIREINNLLGYPDTLSIFGILAHDQTGHERFGITKESLVPEITEAAEKLANLELALEKQPAS